MTSTLFPKSYAEWLECITVRCRISLTTVYVEARLEELKNGQHPRTVEFVRSYGREYTDQVIHWFEIAQLELRR